MPCYRKGKKWKLLEEQISYWESIESCVSKTCKSVLQINWHSYKGSVSSPTECDEDSKQEICVGVSEYAQHQNCCSASFFLRGSVVLSHFLEHREVLENVLDEESPSIAFEQTDYKRIQCLGRRGCIQRILSRAQIYNLGLCNELATSSLPRLSDCKYDMLLLWVEPVHMIAQENIRNLILCFAFEDDLKFQHFASSLSV